MANTKEKKLRFRKTVFNGVTLEVGEKSVHDRRIVSSLEHIRYLGMPTQTNFSIELSPLREKSSYTCFFPVNQKQIEFSGEAPRGITKYNFFVEEVDSKKIVFSKIEERVNGNYNSSGFD